MRLGALTPSNVVGDVQVYLQHGCTFCPSFVINSTPGFGGFVYVAKGANVLGCTIDISKGSVYIGENTSIAPTVTISGPCVIGKDNVLRHGAYLRGDVIVGDDCTLRGEVKNSVMMNACSYPHPGYVGDSICGYKSHFAMQVKVSNIGSTLI